MKLFTNDESADKFYEFQDARENFTRENKKMRSSVTRKTEDSENIEYDKIHVEVYQNVGLKADWSVVTSRNPEELKTASSGFKVVTQKIAAYPNNSIKSNLLLDLIKFFFRKK